MIGVVLITMGTLFHHVTCQDGSVLVDGEILLGGLVPIHSHNSNLLCGELNERVGIQRLEAILYAVDQINRNDTVLGNITLGLEVFDTCSSETIALDRSLHFVKDQASAQENHPAGNPVMVGVIGPSYSSIAVQVAHLFRLFQVPQVSFDSTSYELSDKTRFEFFSRTVPHDLYQAKALVDIAKFMNWLYISVVYSGDSYGTLGYQALVEEAKKAGICIAVAEKIELSTPNNMFGSSINKLLEEPDAIAVMVFSSQDRQIKNLLQAAKDRGLSRKFQWLGTDSWGSVLWLKGLEDAAINTITVTPKTVQPTAFDEYFYKLQPITNSRNPWFKEFWEQHFNCSLDESNNCDKNRLSHFNSPIDTRVSSAVDAVYVFAHALHSLHKHYCPDSIGLCQSMRNISGKEILKFIRNVSFVGASGNHVHFDADGDVQGEYDVWVFTRDGNEYKNVLLGEWNKGLKMRLKGIPNFRKVKSSCRQICRSNEVKVPVIGKESCCWTCQVCDGNSFPLNDSFCAQCPLGYWPTPRGRKCTKNEVLYFGIDWKFSLPAIGLAGFGVFSTLFVICVLIKYQTTPLVKACGRELSHLLLIGILLAFAMTFVTAVRPRDVTCIARFFGNGVVFTICYASLFIKTNRISRIFNRKNLARRPVLILPCSQLGLVVAVVSVQVMLMLMLALLHTPRAQLFHPEISESYLDCSTSDLDFGLSQVYNFVLICVCTVYAFKTRKIPSNFNEAKYIAFAMYSSCIVWLASLAVYYMEDEHERKPLVLCVSVSLIAFVLLGCLYAPKVYVILFRPHRNVRRHVNPSLSLSSLSKEKGQKSAYVGVNVNPDNEDDEQPGSSAEDAMDKKRVLFDSSSHAPMMLSDETGPDEIPNNKSEMEKLIIHLKNELLSTQESLQATQEQLRKRILDSARPGEMKASNLSQGKPLNNGGLKEWGDFHDGYIQDKECLYASLSDPVLNGRLRRQEPHNFAIHISRNLSGFLGERKRNKRKNFGRGKTALQKGKLMSRTSRPRSSKKDLGMSHSSNTADLYYRGSVNCPSGSNSSNANLGGDIEELNQAVDRNATGTFTDAELLRCNGQVDSNCERNLDRQSGQCQACQNLHNYDKDNRIICTPL